MRLDDPRPQIEEYRASGMADAVIFNRLLLEGWSEDALRASLAAPEPAVSIASKYSPKPWGRTTYAIAFFGLFAAGMSGALLFNLASPAPAYSISLPASLSASSTAQLSYGALPALSDPDYYKTIKQQMIADKDSFIDANLSTMQLVVYQDGVAALTVPIMAKGKPGSWWETPAGIYKIETKEPTHLSSIGDVYMPWSMDFQGNFFIHGWPYYPDGTPVSTTFSGGCIRLSTDDAKRVYDLARTGMPVVVYNETKASDNFQYNIKTPSVSASEYLVADLNDGTVLASKNASTTAQIASITKLVTALVSTEYINLDKKITVPQSALVYTTVPRLAAGQSIRSYDLLFLLLQESSNEAAETLASALGRDTFVARMNQKAKAIGLSDTQFVDPSGAKEDVSTSEDLFTLLKYIYNNRQFVFSIAKGDTKDSAYGTSIYSSLNNFNKIPGTTEAFLGGKVGETLAAKKTYAGLFSVPVGDSQRTIAVIVLGSDDEYADVRSLISFVKNTYASAN